MEHKNQHTVPESYLRAWCDPDTPRGQEPFVWLWTKDGKSHFRKAPRNVFCETEIYTLRQPGGARDLALERMLSQMEGDFAEIRRKKIDRREPMAPLEMDRLITFVAALHARSSAHLHHLRSKRSRVVEFADKLTAQVARATPAQRKAMAMMPVPPGQSISVDEFRRLVEKPHRTLAEQVMAEATVMSKMKIALFDAPPDREFITSDVPVTWFDPELYKRPPFYRVLGLAYPMVEVTMPISPNSLLYISHHAQFGGRRFIASKQMADEFNRRARFECNKHFVTRTERMNDYWFFDMQPPAA
jgi:hypothetical protein